MELPELYIASLIEEQACAAGLMLVKCVASTFSLKRATPNKGDLLMLSLDCN
jgi:hypothetical protein